ncbi:MAG: outer membrane beta-barrel protein [Beijerinckiaceae bacterium]|nr:outer membrane beta-barrel protein [Beijerinckiaceae bacterium]
MLSLLQALAAAGAARAADLPSKIVPPLYQPPPAEFSWTGFYAGIHAGGGVDHFGFKYSFNTPRPRGYIQGSTGITARGPVGGLQIGFNYELPFFHIVAGLEIDNSASGIRGQTTFNNAFLSGAPYTVTFGTKFENFGTARLRLGYAWGRFMPFFAFGFTYGVVETSYSFATPGFFSSASSTAVRSGIFPHVGTVGIGLEYAFATNFTVKAEYLYEFINARRTLFTPGDGTTISFGTRTMYHIGRVGLNYKFDWLSPAAPPALAKY